MNRPTISPAVVGQLTEAAPGRLIRKLDKDPERADAWEWATDDDTTTVTTDADAVVTLNGAVISSVDQVSCDCLLAPKCLHLLSVVTRLELADVAAPDVEDAAGETDSGSDSDVELDVVAINDEHREVAQALLDAMSHIVADGVGAASIVAQGQLLTALHNARVIGMHRASGSATRAIKRIRHLRSGSSEKIDLLRDDLLDLFDACQSVLNSDEVTIAELGVARRKYRDAGSLRLHGIVTAPIYADGGYGGCVTYMLDDKGDFSTVSTVQPRDRVGAQQAWQTSVQIGDVTAPHAELCRKQVFIQDATRSDDGRLGAGKKVKAVVGKPVDFDADPIKGWFETPIKEQIDRVYERADLPYLIRPPGWDFIAFEATVLGACEDGVLLSLGSEESEETMAPIIGRPVGDRRDNLGRLAKMIGQTFRFVGRVILDELRSVQLVTILYSNEDGETQSVQLGMEHFQLPREDETIEHAVATIPNVWGAYDRAVERAMLGGWRAFPPQCISDIRREQIRLKRSGMTHGAARLAEIYRASQRDPETGQSDRYAFAKAWRDGVMYREYFLRAVAQAEW